MGPHHTAVDVRPAIAPDHSEHSGDSSDSPGHKKKKKESKKQRFMASRWGQTRRPIATAAGVALVVLVLVVVAAVMLKDGLGPNSRRSTSLSLDDILQDTFLPRPFNGSWVSDSEILYKDWRNNAILFNLYSLTGQTLTTNYHVIPTNTGPVEYQLSTDRRYMLAIHNKTKVFGQTTLAQYEIIDLQKQTSQSLENIGKAADRHLLQYVVWIPGKNGIIYVYRNNLYYRPSTLLDIELQLTKTGVPGLVYNGITDLIYRESVMKTEIATWLSPNGRRLAFVTFNDTKVHASYLPYYGSPSSPEYQYPRNIEIRYPKPGTPHPTVIVSVLDLDYQLQKRLSTLYAPIPRGMAREEVLLTGVAWMNNDEIATVWMNRVQSYATITVFNYESGGRYDLLKVEEDTGWLQPIPAPFFSSEFKRMLLIIPQDQGGMEGKYPHIVLVQQSRNKALIKPLTTGKYSVTKILAWDSYNNIVYFLANEIGYSSIQHLYSVSDDQWTAPNNPVCISCNVKTTDGQMPCLYNTALFNRNYSFYILNCAGPDVPEISIYDKHHQKVTVWESNHQVRRALEEVRDFPPKQFLQVGVENGFKAHVELILPPDYNPKRNTKYPMLVYVDGEPDTCQVTERFSIGWNAYMAGNKSVVVAIIDGRGTGLRGSAMAYQAHRKLGSVEIEDQIHVTRYLQEHFTFIDSSKTAIWGRHYGGYSATMALIKDVNNVFQCGIAISPITEWLYYDSVTTERYMGLPTIEDNRAGYIDAGLTNKVENLRYKKFLLIHGTFDSVVHYQQSMMLSKVLQQQDILFTQQSYPDEDTLTGIKPHLYHTMEKFLDDCFKSV